MAGLGDVAEAEIAGMIEHGSDQRMHAQRQAVDGR